MTWDYQIAARTLYGEARGETDEGQRAVAHVLYNRLRDGRWGKSLATVCLWQFQFSCWNTGDPNRREMAALPEDNPMLVKLGTILDEVRVASVDPTSGATHYYANTMIIPPKWAASGADWVGDIGHHKFYRNVK